MSELRSRNGGFAQIPMWVLLSDVSDRAKVLYAVLQSHVNRRTLRPISLHKATLARELGCSTERLHAAKKELEGIGALFVEPRKAASGANAASIFTLLADQPASVGGSTDGSVDRSTEGSVGGSTDHYEPEVTSSEPEIVLPSVELSSDAGTSRRRNDGWDALVAVFQREPQGAAGRKLYGKLAKELNDEGIDTPALLMAAQRYEMTWPSIGMTETALVKHAPTLLRPNWQPPKSERQAETERIYSGLFAESVQHGGLGGAGRIHQGGLPELEGGGDDG